MVVSAAAGRNELEECLRGHRYGIICARPVVSDEVEDAPPQLRIHDFVVTACCVSSSAIRLASRSARRARSSEDISDQSIRLLEPLPLIFVLLVRQEVEIDVEFFSVRCIPPDAAQLMSLRTELRTSFLLHPLQRVAHGIPLILGGFDPLFRDQVVGVFRVWPDGSLPDSDYALLFQLGEDSPAVVDTGSIRETHNGMARKRSSVLLPVIQVSHIEDLVELGYGLRIAP
jgi:hypothetical protein